MTPVIAFDIYGTLIDTHGVVALLEKFIGSDATKFSEKWREKQLEYSFRRGLMSNYKAFSTCTEASLEYTCKAMQVSLTDDQKQMLLDKYRNLPCFDDVIDVLKSLTRKYRLVAFSNGDSRALDRLLNNVGIDRYFELIISAEEAKTFKPDPVLYHHLLRRVESRPGNAYLVSSNPFDIIGARSVSINAVWVKRHDSMIFDPWEYEPTSIIRTLRELPARLP